MPAEVYQLLRKREGVRTDVYRDSEGYLTAGVGHKLTDSEIKKYPYGTIVSKDLIDTWERQDVSGAYKAAVNQAAAIGTTDTHFIAALTSVNFQLGTAWNQEHVKTWGYMKAHEWEKAAVEAEDSSWFRQTPVRVRDLQEALRSLTGKPVNAEASSEQPGGEFHIGAPIDTGTVIATMLNVRSGAGTEHERVGAALSQGAAVTIYGMRNGWYCIGERQWVSAQYVVTTKQQSGNSQTKGAAQPGPDFKAIAKEVWEAMFGGLSIGTDEEKVYRNLAKLNHDTAFIAKFKDTYRAMHGTDIIADIHSEFSDNIFGNELTKALSYLSAGSAHTAKSVPSDKKTTAASQKKPSGGAQNYKTVFYSKYYSDAVKNETATGVPALVTLGQAALESGWGKHAPGNNFFGVKAKKDAAPEDKQLLRTKEVLKRSDATFPEVISVTPRDDGKYDYVVRDWFRKYPTAAQGFADHAKVLLGKRYKEAFNHKDDPYAFAQAIADAGYATDPGYAKKLKGVMHELESFGGSASGGGAATSSSQNAPATPKASTQIKEKKTVSASGVNTAGLDPALVSFIADLKSDKTYGAKIVVTSTLRDVERDARAVLNNQRANASYITSTFKKSAQPGLLKVVEGLNLSDKADFETAVQRFIKGGHGGPHVRGRAVDFGLAGGDSGFRNFLEKEAKSRGFTFVNESKHNHYHVQM